MTRQKINKKPKETLVVRIPKEQKDILRRNVDENTTMSKMVKDALSAYIIQNNLK